MYSFILYILKNGQDCVETDLNLIEQGFPETFVKLDQFFSDLCTKHGSQTIFDVMNTKRVLDIFMLCTRFVNNFIWLYRSLQTKNYFTFSSLKDKGFHSNYIILQI